jgi:hypothetical protein
MIAPTISTEGCVSPVAAADECWKPIPGCEGFYSVSTFGRVRSEPIRTSNVGGQRGRILVCCPEQKGYLLFCAYMPDGRRKTMRVHRAVALAFLGPRPPGYQINHKSGDKLDNSVGNLEYITCRENIRHAWKTGLCDPAQRQGENSPTAKLTAEQVYQVRDASPAMSLGELSRRFGVTKQTIWGIVHRKTWQHLQPKEPDNRPSSLCA